MSKAAEYAKQMAKACDSKPPDFIVGSVTIATVDGSGRLCVTNGAPLSAADALALAAWISLNFGG